MTKSIKIVYEDWSISAGNIFESKIKEAIVDFDGNNTPYIDSMSYADNFDCFVHDAFGSGFVYITPQKAVSILQIKSFEFNHVVEGIKDTISVNVTPQPATPNTSNRKPNKRKIRKQRKPIAKNDSAINNVANDGAKNEG